jgi:DNA-binding beta-propeller fold protein YncE
LTWPVGSINLQRAGYLGACLATFLLVPDAAAGPDPLVLDKAISMPQVRGRVDHLGIDLSGERLFVAALGNDSVEIIDLRAGQWIGRVESLREPQGVVFMARTGQVFVANAGGGISILAGAPLRISEAIAGLDDADNVRVDSSAERRLYVGYGRALAVIDVATRRVIDRIALAGHPEGFQLDPHGARIFVNVPSASQIAVVDRDKHEQIATWRLVDAAANFPMAVDAVHRRLFVGTRRPPKLLAFDLDRGNVVATLPIGGDVDDLFYDEKRQRIYAVCGEGVVTVIEQSGVGDYRRVGEVRTAPGARTGLFAPERDALYVAVPARATSPAEIRVYATR